MDKSNRACTPATRPKKPTARRDSISAILQGLNRMTGRLYVVLASCFVGRCIRGYRKLDDALGGERRRSARCRRAVSRRRLLLADSVKNSFLSKFLSGILSGLYHLPARAYGLFAVLYGVFSTLCCLFLPRIFSSADPEIMHYVVAGAMTACGIPLLTTSDSLRAAVSKSHLASAVLTNYLCIPKTPEPAKRKKMSVLLAFSVVFLAAGAALGTMFLPPFALPIGLLALALFGIILNYPEAGAILVTALLPVVWLWPSTMLPLAILILLTWLSYALKILQLRRTVHWDILDIVGVLLFIIAFVAGVGGVLAGTGNARDSVKLLACLSVYFFMVHLLNTRTYIRRCLIGVGVTTVLVMLAGLFLQPEPIGILHFPGDDSILKITETVEMSVFNRDSEHRSLLTVMTFPLLCAFLLRSKRLFSRFASLLLLALNVYLIAASSSVGTILCTLGVGVLLCLLLDHRCLAGGILLLPCGIGAGGWYLTRLDPFSRETMENISRQIFEREMRVSDIWPVIAERPMGLGLGADCAGATLFFEVLLCLGWPGMIAMILFLLLLLQKGLTALSHTVVFTDRALLVGLTCGVVGFILRGLTYGFLSEPRAILTLALLAGLLSALANVLFRETDVREAEFLNCPEGVDRLYHRG